MNSILLATFFLKRADFTKIVQNSYEVKFKTYSHKKLYIM